MFGKLYKGIIVLIVLIVNLLIVYPYIVYADSGPKPTITIYVQNYDNKNYFLDLLGQEGNYGYFDATGPNQKYKSMNDTPIYKYNENGWKAIHMRTELLNGDLVGTYEAKSDEIVHKFSYIGVPKMFKIIIQKEDGSLQVSKSINANYFNTAVIYDMSKNTFTIRNAGLLPNNFIIRCLFTIVMELLLAFLVFGINNWKVISLTNVVTQLILNLALRVFFRWSSFNFGIMYIIIEVLIVIFEFYIYFKLIKNISKRKLLIFSFTANSITFLLGLLLF